MADKINYKSVLNASQYEAASTIDGAMLIIAGAGTGKTATLIHRVAYMIEHGIEPESILLLTFTNKAADEMKMRAAKILKEKDETDDRCSRITACTYHSFCAKMLRRYAGYVNLPYDYKIISETDVCGIISIIMADNPEEYKLEYIPEAKNIAEIFSKMTNKQMELKEILAEQYEPEFAEILTIVLDKLHKDYEDYKIKKNMLDYDDLLLTFNELLDIDQVREQISENYMYVCVDEYQDTNNLQEQIVFKMIETYENITVVGDDYQSIYAFRGSDVNNFINFPKKFDACKIVKLEKNYRSTVEILNVANEMMRVNADFGYSKTMESNTGNGDKPVKMYFDDVYKQAAGVADEIIRLAMKENVKYRDIAVLQKNSRSSAILELNLLSAGIPFKKIGGKKFTEKNCIQNVINILKVITNPMDSIAWFDVLQLIYGVGDIYAGKIIKNVTDVDFLSKKFEERNHMFENELKELDKTIKNMRASKMDACALINDVITYYIQLRRIFISKSQGSEAVKKAYEMELKRDIKDLKHLKQIVSTKKGLTVKKLLEDIMAGSDVIGNKEYITISTIHSAKGLEWDNCFILDCTQEMYPDKSCDFKTPFECEEALRVLYVAVTRARKRLYLCVPEYDIKGRKVAECVYLSKLNKNLFNIEGGEE